MRVLVFLLILLQFGVLFSISSWELSGNTRGCWVRQVPQDLLVASDSEGVSGPSLCALWWLSHKVIMSFMVYWRCGYEGFS